MSISYFPIRKLFLPSLIISLSVFLCYFPTFTGEFLLDDHVLVENNLYIRDSQSLSSYLSQEDGILNRTDYKNEYHTGYYRPLINLSYYLDYITWGMKPFGFRLTNLIWHIGVSISLFALMIRLEMPHKASVLATLIFALHPVNTEAVSWISSRNNMICAFFALITIHVFVFRRNNNRRFIAVVISGFTALLAMLAKEFGVMIPFVLVVFDLFGEHRPKKTHGRWLAEYFPIVIALLIYLALRISVTPLELENTGDLPHLGFRFLYLPFVGMFYLRILLLPIGLHNFLIFYPKAPFSMEFAAALIVWLLVGILVFYWRRRSVAIIGIVSFLIGLFPVANIIPTSAVTLGAMRWVYFSAVFLALSLAVGITQFKDNRILIKAIFILLIPGLGLSTLYLNIVQWKNDRVFFTREVTVFDNRLYAGGYARILKDKGQVKEAEKYFLQAIEAVPNMVEPYIDYSVLLLDTGRPSLALKVLNHIKNNEMIRDNFAKMENNSGMALMMLNRADEAIIRLGSAVRATPYDSGIWANYANALAISGNYSKAIRAFQQAIKLNPESKVLKRQLAQTYHNIGDERMAEKTLNLIKTIDSPVDRSLNQDS